MTDTPFLQLSDKWRLAHDPLQWVIQRRRADEWRSEKFIASTRDVLMRDLREMGAVVDEAALDELDDLPATFREWLKTQKASRKRFKASCGANPGVILTGSREAA